MGGFVSPLTGHIDAALTNYAKGYDQPELIGRRVAPILPVMKESGLWWVHGREMQENFNDDQRPRGGRPNRIRIGKTTTAYRCTSHALEAQVPDEDADGYELGDLVTEGVETAMSQILTKLETRLAAALSDTAKLTKNETIAAADRWNNSGGKPIERILYGKKQVLLNCGRQPNLCVMGADVVFELLNHASFIERLKYVTRGGTTRNDLASVIFPENDGEVVIGSGTVVDRTGAASFAWGKHVVLAYVNPTPGLRDPSAFRTVTWANAPGTSGGIGVLRFRDPYANAKAEIGSVDFYYDEKNFVVNADAAYLIKTAVD
jgi:hypothetical protein